MATLINASIDLAKIEKSKIFEKDGKKWLSLSISVNDEPNNYGQNVAISIGQSKEEKGQPKTYLGNGKVVWTDGKSPTVVQATPQQESKDDDDLPF